MKIIDLSHNLNNESPVYPADDKVVIKNVADLSKDGFNMYELKSNMHVSTHVEVSMHFADNNKFISSYKLENFIGNAIVLNFKGENIINWKKEFESIIKENDCVLIYTGFDKYYDSDIYYKKHPALSIEFVNKLIEKNIKLIGLDFASPDYYPYEVHKTLLNNNISIVENLKDINKLINYNEIKFFTVPIKIDAEASFTRAFAICSKLSE